MLVRDALLAARRRLAVAGVASAAHDAEALLAHLLGVPRTKLPWAGALTGTQAEAFEHLVRRRARREPLQHLTGRASFRHVEVEVGAGVFVPRPETELLAGWAVDVLCSLDRPVAVDLCTGSGAIALSLATEVPGCRVHAVELSEDAHAYAQRNLAGSGVDLRLGDVTDALTELDGEVDVVVANPPYIPLTAYDVVALEARDHDPPEALWSGPDGLEMVRVVAGVAARLLRPGGWLGCEHADVQGASAPAAVAAGGHWTDVQDHHDLTGRPRFLTARRVAGGTMVPRGQAVRQ
ncbi:MAG: peptide chain release factor N(5)-glutamine methyltransferase [Actinomycetota bacterium]|nr:peptide chain release factor N(5)-glutamine methyltransferase [Actinomycetota bacterium]